MFTELLNSLWNNLHQHIYIMVCTLIMFILQRRRARRIFRYQRETVVIFSRYPVPGKTKTRLRPGLGDNGAARAQHLMTDHMVDRLLAYQQTHTDLSIDIQYTGGTEDQMHAWFGRRRDNASGSLTWNEQRGTDLGSRMKSALMKHLAQGEDRVVIIGSDIPSLEATDIEDAMKALRREDNLDIVLGQSTDGGYYMVGGNTNIMPHLDTLFEGIKWSTDSVFVQQKLKALQLGLRLHVLRRKLSDVDTPDDLENLKSNLGLSQEDLLFPRWSIVIPTLNEGENITHTIKNVINTCDDPNRLEIIAVDGGSTDDTCQRVKKAAASLSVPISLLHSEKGRGLQQNTGAEAATGYYLMFLHADTKLPEKFESKAEMLLTRPGTSAGAFQLGFDVIHIEEKRQSYSKIFYYKMKFIESMANFRARSRELPYGDQALFMTRPMFKSVGGFPNWPLLEDLNLVKKLQKKGTIGNVPGDPCMTSARRWEKHGAFKITLLNQFVLIAYSIGVSPQRLARWYYGKPKSD